MSDHKYDNAVGPYNAYGHCLELLGRHTAPSGGVHLDLACGLGPIAEPLIASHGVHYVGVDYDPDTVKTLKERGFEAHALDLNSPEVEQNLRRVLDSRKLASISMLDGLEHLVEGHHVLAAISVLLAEHRTLCVLSVPNVTHVDIGIKTLLGKWDYTETGLLDRTHYHLYSAPSLEDALSEAGLAKVADYDVVMAESDQHFPPDHGALRRATPLGHYLRTLRESIDPHGYTNQFVWAVAPTAAMPGRDLSLADEGPFLSVIMRTQGRRDQELREALLSLAAQSSTNFELLLVAHRTTVAQQIQVERVIADQPQEFRDRIRLLLLDTGRRAAPLNHAMRHARGRYLVILDDDDIVLEGWVATFEGHEQVQPGRIMRVQAAVHDVARTQVRGLTGVRGIESPRTPYAATFSLTDHIATNQSPTHTWAFPVTLHRDFGMVFDETMTTTEDWEFLIRAAEVVGVQDIPTVLAIYQWWVSHESSRTQHDEDDWRQNHSEVHRRLDRKPLLLPAAETRALRARLRRLDELENVLAEHAELRAQLATLERESRADFNALQGEAFDLLGQLRRERQRTAILRKRIHKLRSKLPEGGKQGGSKNGGSKQGGSTRVPQARKAPVAEQVSIFRRAGRIIKRRLS